MNDKVFVSSNRAKTVVYLSVLTKLGREGYAIYARQELEPVEARTIGEALIEAAGDQSQEGP